MEIRKAEEKDIAGVCNMLVRRMADSAEASHHLEGIKNKEKLFSQIISVQIADIFRYGEIWIAGDFIGGLAGFYGKNVTFWDSLRSAVALNRKLGGTIDKEDLIQFSANTKKMLGTQNGSWRKQASGSKNYYYIQLVAINESAKGQGVFRQLMEPVLARLERENIPALIDTHDQTNVPIYEHFGFELFKAHQAKNGAPIFQYSMIKRP